MNTLQQKLIKRYSLGHVELDSIDCIMEETDYDTYIGLEEHDDGKWVLWEDVKDLIDFERIKQ